MSLGKKVGIASAIMMASVLLSRMIGVAREIVIAYIGGATGAVDAYLVSFTVPEILNHIVASGFLSVTFIPIFSEYLARNREEEGWQVFSLILTCFGGLLLLFIAAGHFFTSDLIDLAARGRADPQFKSTAVRMTRIIIPAQFFFFAGGLFMAVQFAKEKFFIPALAPLIYNLGIIGGGLVLGDRYGMEGFSWGVLAGAFIGNFALQYWGARRVGLKFRLNFNVRHPDFKTYIGLTLPLMIGLTMMFSMEIFIRFFGSYLPAGHIAGLNYSRTILLIPVGLFGQAVGVASFPFMARLVAENRLTEMNRLLNDTLRFLALVLPFSALVMVLRHEIVQLLFQRGRFDAAATDLTAPILIYLLPAAFALSAYAVVVRGFYAAKNTWFPALFGTCAVLASLPLYWYGMQWLGARGIALAVAVSAFLQAGLLYGLWNRKTANADSRRVYGFTLKILAISLLLGGVIEWLRVQVAGLFVPGTAISAAGVCLTVGGVFTLLLLAAGRVFGIPEIRIFFQRLRAVILRR
jgi:putative peptidoglycan lipid II flippase